MPLQSSDSTVLPSSALLPSFTISSTRIFPSVSCSQKYEHHIKNGPRSSHFIETEQAKPKYTYGVTECGESKVRK